MVAALGTIMLPTRRGIRDLETRRCYPDVTTLSREVVRVTPEVNEKPFITTELSLSDEPAFIFRVVRKEADGRVVSASYEREV